MTYEAVDPHYRERVEQSFARQQFMDFIGAELVEVRPGFCQIHVPYRQELTQQHGFFHAGIIGTVADNCAGYAGFSLMAPDSSVLTVEYKLNLMAPGEGDLLIGRAEVLRRGRTLTVCRADVFVRLDGKEKQCAAAQVTLMELQNTPDK